MKNFPIFLSVIYVVQNLESKLCDILKDASSQLISHVRDHEIIIIDNASNDNSVKLLKKLSGPDGIPNLQVYALTNEVDKDMAVMVGLENALGDFTLIINPKTDDISILTEILINLKDGVDVILAKNKENKAHGFLYSIANYIFNVTFRFFNGINLPDSTIGCQFLTRKVVNFILQNSSPELAYRYLPVTTGFTQTNLEYSIRPMIKDKKKLITSIERGIRLLISTTQAPIRIVTLLSIFGALVNLLYSFYIIIVALVKEDVAEGWVSLSMQNSGMFFIFSLTLFFLSEYILHMIRFGDRRMSYHIAQEFTSVRMMHKEKLNLEAAPPPLLLENDYAGCSCYWRRVLWFSYCYLFSARTWIKTDSSGRKRRQIIGAIFIQ